MMLRILNDRMFIVLGSELDPMKNVEEEDHYYQEKEEVIVDARNCFCICLRKRNGDAEINKSQVVSEFVFDCCSSII